MDEKARFRVRTSHFEVEYEGPAESAWSRYDNLVSRLQTASSSPLSEDTLTHASNSKSKRGGIRSSVIANAVDLLINEEWLKTKRAAPAILEELVNRRVPGVDKKNLKVALDRRVRAGKLRSIMDTEEWVYWSN